MKRRALCALVAYYAATGLWPLVAMESFEAVTGPKREHWLVNMVGALALANAAALAIGARRPTPKAETVALATATAIAFTAVDVVYVLRGRLRTIYLADAGIELALAAAIAFGD